MFKVSGATVYPVEVERGLASIPGVAQAFVVGVDTGGHLEVGAVVVGRDLEVTELWRAARQALSSFKVPTVWALLGSEAEIPRLASDKPDIGQLRHRLIQEGLRAAASLPIARHTRGSWMLVRRAALRCLLAL
jgi:acyl-coenzyme A synthetase/AMP-(fatty) acid ligase